MSQMFANAARGELLYGIGAADTAFTLDGAAGGAFPVANRGTSSSGTWFRAVLVHADKSNYEIVRVRTHASGSSTFSNVLRAQEGTTAQSFAAGAVVGLRPTAEDAAGWTLPEGGTSDDHLDGGRAWTNTAAKVRGTPLTGLSTGSGADVVATDSILAAIGKLARKILDHFGVGGGAHPLATTSVHGFFASAEKVKLSGIAENAAALGSATPSALGTASAGSSDSGSRQDHVHPMPTASQVGATPAAHASNTSNPHSVTAAQVGAAATVHSHAISDVTGLSGQLSDLGTKLPLISASTRTLALSDAGQIVYASSNITIPSNSSVAFPVGTVITLVNSSSTDSSVSITTDTLRHAGTTNTGTRTLGGYGVATLLKVSSTQWMISGAGLT